MLIDSKMNENAMRKELKDEILTLNDEKWMKSYIESIEYCNIDELVYNELGNFLSFYYD